MQRLLKSHLLGISLVQRDTSYGINIPAWKVAQCDNQHSVTREDRVMNRSSLGKGKDRQQVVVGKSSGKSNTILYSGQKPILYILLGV